MPATFFHSRLLCDMSFYKEHIKGNFSLFRELMWINSYSKHHRKDHVFISNKNYQQIAAEDPKIAAAPDLLKAGLRTADEPDIERIGDEVERNIDHAINLSSKPPHLTPTIILTTGANIQAYLNSPTIQGMTKVTAKMSDDAIAIIHDFYSDILIRD